MHNLIAFAGKVKECEINAVSSVSSALSCASLTALSFTNQPAKRVGRYSFIRYTCCCLNALAAANA